jgi:hypothetical protein
LWFSVEKQWFLAVLLHVLQLGEVELRIVDIAPVTGCRIHRKAGSDCAVGANHDIVLASPAVPVGKMQITILFAYNPAG